MKKQAIALMLSVALMTAGCAAARAQGPRVSSQPSSSTAADPDLMAHYVRQLPPGSRVRVALADGTVIHGTLMKADADPIMVQRRTRIPERPLAIAIKEVRALELEKNGGAGRAVAIGAAAGAGAALGVLMILAAIFAGD
jgi:hypothetical protein